MTNLLAESQVIGYRRGPQPDQGVPNSALIAFTRALIAFTRAFSISRLAVFLPN